MPGLVLVTGASGYVGGRLVPALLEAGYRVRAMSRTSGWLRDYPWAADVEQVSADALQPDDLAAVLDGVEVVYYLIHSLSAGAEYADRDRRAAENMAAAAAAAGVRRIVYLGGLADTGADLSPHLASRAEVGRILLASGVPTVVVRAAVVIGSGSASFEMLRYLTERLPVMITPKWVNTRVQPVAIRDVLHYLVSCAELAPHEQGILDIGGPDVLTYRGMMDHYAEIADLKARRILPVPLLSLGLSSLWVGLVTPLPMPLARPLVESLRIEVVIRRRDVDVPDPPAGRTTFDTAVRLALKQDHDFEVATRWSQAEWPGAPDDPLPSDSLPSDPDWAGGTRFLDERHQSVAAPIATTWAVVSGIGGDNGWYSLPLAWWIRGVADRLAGGVGLRRGRRDPDHLRVGDTLDWWRVEEVIAPRLLRLRAEMRVPGRAWLEFELLEDGPGCTLTQRAVFYPRGLAGQLYWRSIAPFHTPVFAGMLANIGRAAERRAAAEPAERAPGDDGAVTRSLA